MDVVVVLHVKGIQVRVYMDKVCLYKVSSDGQGGQGLTGQGQVGQGLHGQGMPGQGCMGTAGQSAQASR